MSLVGSAASTLGWWVSLISTGPRTTSNGGRVGAAGVVGVGPSAAMRGSTASSAAKDVGRVAAGRCGSGRAGGFSAMSANDVGNEGAGPGGGGGGAGGGFRQPNAGGGGGGW